MLGAFSFVDRTLCSNNKSRPDCAVAAFVDDADLIQRDMGDLAVVVAQVQYSVSHIYHLTSIDSGCADRDIDLFAHILV